MGRSPGWLYDDDDDEVVGEATDAEPLTMIGARLPATVVVPAHPRADNQGISIELSAAVTGAPVAIVFSTVERLIERLGGHQPWIMIPAVALPGLLGTTAISIVLDPLEKTCRAQWTGDRLYDMELYQHGIEPSEPIRGDIRA